MVYDVCSHTDKVQWALESWALKVHAISFIVAVLMVVGVANYFLGASFRL